jgi:hypothetical protein
VTPGFNVVARMIARRQISARHGARCIQPLVTGLGNLTRMVPAAMPHAYRRVTAHQPMELAERSRPDVPAVEPPPVTRLLERTHRLETEMLRSSSRVVLPAARRTSMADEPSPARLRSTLDAPHDNERFPAAPALSSATTLDVERLTDQVLRHIDRRVTAWRERMGRR